MPRRPRRCRRARSFRAAAAGPRRMVAPPGGMGEFTTRLHDALLDRGVRFQFDTRCPAIDAECRRRCARGAPAAARLLAPHAPELAARIARRALAPLATVTCSSSRIPPTCVALACCFPKLPASTRSACCSTPTSSNGARRLRSETWIVGDRAARITAWPDASVAPDAGRRPPLPDRPPGRTARRSHHALARGGSGLRPGHSRCAAALASLPPWLALAATISAASAWLRCSNTRRKPRPIGGHTQRLPEPPSAQTVTRVTWRATSARYDPQ